jgi:cystathionine gamma-synthase
VLIDRSTTWPYEDGEPGPFSYIRANHPAGVAAEQALGDLDGGHALLFPSGMAAVTTLLLTLLGPDTTVALAEGAYYGHRSLLDRLSRWRIRPLEFDQTGAPPAADLVLLEAPANPLLTMPDFAAATNHSAVVVCDSTLSTPVFTRPLEQGCDVTLHSATKFLAGHDDVLAGVLVLRDEHLVEELRETRRLTGAVASPDSAWLVLRGLKTLRVRVERQTASAQLLVDRLRAHPAVETVRYPGFGGVVSFDVADGTAAHSVETGVKRIVNATSLGGTVSKLEARHRWEGDRIPSGLIRLSVGLEDPEVIWSDLEHALATTEAGPAHPPSRAE